MARLRVPVGILISSDGPYSVVSKSMLCGALLGIAEAQAEHRDLEIEPIIANPRRRQRALFRDGRRDASERHSSHVVGCYTSSSRKEIIPLFEKADALLWYPSHYEGFESSSNVVYTGAVANQHLLPLVEYLLSYVGPKAFCVGSNYIWAWENNRILREAIGPNGGTVVAERYFPVGCTEFGQAIDAILAARPSFVFNTLIGESSYQFLRDLRAACRSRGIDQAREIPVASCTLSEPELAAIGPAAVDGHITSSVYFSSLDTPENDRFVKAYRGPVSRRSCRVGRRRGDLSRRAPSRARGDGSGHRRSLRRQAGGRAAPNHGAAGRSPDRCRDHARVAHASHRVLEPGRRLHRVARSDAAGAGRSLPHPQFVTLRRCGHPTRPASRLMTTHRLIQNFRRSQGLLWAGPDFNADVLERTLLKLGVSLRRVESVSASDLDPDRDIVFLDADQPINPAPLLLPGANLTAAPVIGIVGVEAPSRLKLLAEAGATAILRKPIQAATVYSALFLGVNNHRRLKSAETRLAIGDRKRRGRRFLIKAVVALVQTRGLSDDDAYAELRRESMRRRLGSRGVLRIPVPAGQQFSGRVACWPRALNFT